MANTRQTPGPRAPASSSRPCLWQQRQENPGVVCCPKHTVECDAAHRRRPLWTAKARRVGNRHSCTVQFTDIPARLRAAPFTTEQAAALGVTLRMLQGRAHWRRIFREVWVHASVEDSLELRFQAV